MKHTAVVFCEFKKNVFAYIIRACDVFLVSVICSVRYITADFNCFELIFWFLLFTSVLCCVLCER